VVCALVGKRFKEREREKGKKRADRERKRMVFAALWDWEG